MAPWRAARYRQSRDIFLKAINTAVHGKNLAELHQDPAYNTADRWEKKYSICYPEYGTLFEEYNVDII